MSKRFSVISGDLPPAKAGARKGSNQALLTKLKQDFEAERVVVYSCKCDSPPVDCLYEDISIVISFNSDLIPCNQGIPAVRLTRVNNLAKSANQ